MGAGRRAAWVAVLAAGLGVGPARAAVEPSITARVDHTDIQVGDTVSLEVTLRVSANVRAGQLLPPDLDGWRLVSRTERSQTDGMTGVTSQRLTLGLQAERRGLLTIGAFTLKADGQQAKTPPIQVRVGGVGPAPAAQPSEPPAPEPAAAAEEGPPDRLMFLRWEVDKPAPWLGEQIDARLYVYVNRAYAASRLNVGDINLEGFWNEDSPRRQPHRRAEMVVVGADAFVREEVTSYRLFPMRTGELPLPEVEVTSAIAERLSFGGGREQITRAAPPLPLDVKALPSTGRPADFAGPAVGQVEVTASIDRNRIRPDEGVQLTVVTRVRGLVAHVPAVALPDLRDFRSYPPTETTHTSLEGSRVVGRRTQTWLLKPRRKGRLTVPALTRPYFDPRTGTYEIAKTPTLRVEVTGAGQPAGASGAGGADEPGAGGDDEARPAFRTIRKESDLAGEDRAAYASAWFFAAVCLPPLLLLGLVGRDVLGRRLRSRAPDRTMRRAPGVARATLSRLAGTTDAAAAFSGIARALVQYLETRLGTALNGLTHLELTHALTARRIPRPVVDALVTELENCDFARFTPAGARSAELKEAASRASALVDRVEEALR